MAKGIRRKFTSTSIGKYSVTYPMKREQGKTFTVVVETVGQAMRVTIDGKPAAYFESPGIRSSDKIEDRTGRRR